MSLEDFNLADLSPTTGNVPVSDEYKVEWVKAKAELRRQKSAAYTTTVCDPSEQICDPTVASVLQSSDSSHSSDSAQCLSEAPHSLESSMSQEARSTNNLEQSEPTGISPKVDVLQSAPMTTTSGNFSGPSLSRPSSLKISPRLDQLSSGHINTNDAMSTASATTSLNSFTTQLSDMESEPQLSASANVEESSRSAYDLGLHTGNLVDIGAVYDSSFDVAIQETAASDDVKSTVAAMKSLFERNVHRRSVSFGANSNENLTFGTTMRSLHSSRLQTKIEEEESETLSPPKMNLVQTKKK